MMARFTLGRPWSDRTADRYTVALENLATFMHQELQREPLALDLTRTILEDYKLAMLTSKANATVRADLATAMRFWAWAYDRDDRWPGQVPPPRKIDLPQVDEYEPTGATWAQWDALLEHLQGWPWRLVVLVRYTGLRREAAMALRWHDVDLEAQEIRVRSQTTKGRRSGRILPIVGPLLAELGTWPQRDGRVIPGSSRFLSKLVREGWQTTGVPSDVWEGQTLHGIRHTLSDHFTRLDVPDRVIQYVIGHRSGKTLDRHYRPSASLMRKVREALETVPPHREQAPDNVLILSRVRRG